MGKQFRHSGKDCVWIHYDIAVVYVNGNSKQVFTASFSFNLSTYISKTCYLFLTKMTNSYLRLLISNLFQSTCVIIITALGCLYVVHFIELANANNHMINFVNSTGCKKSCKFM